MERIVEDSQWSDRKSFRDTSLNRKNVVERHKDGTIGDLLAVNGIDNCLNIYNSVLPNFRIGQKISQSELAVMRMNQVWTSSSGREGWEERYRGVLIIGRCHNCGNHLEGHYGCPKCRTGADGYPAQKAVESTFWDEVKRRELSKNWMGARV